jgi:hypothetical protein
MTKGRVPVKAGSEHPLSSRILLPLVLGAQEYMIFTFIQIFCSLAIVLACCKPFHLTLRDGGDWGFFFKVEEIKLCLCANGNDPAENDDRPGRK